VQGIKTNLIRKKEEKNDDKEEDDNDMRWRWR
jgi:hypothetical protein